MNGLIYYIYHVESGKGYIGKHRYPILLARFKHHCWDKSKSPLHSAIRKYGKEAFKVVQLDRGSSDEELFQKEIFWIDRLNTLYPNGYNLSIGGDGLSGWNPSETTRKAISLANKGFKMSQETKDKISLANKGVKRGPRSEIERKAISLGKKGTTVSHETKQKISKSMKGKVFGPCSEETKKAISLANSNPPEETRRAISIAKKGQISTRTVSKEQVQYIRTCGKSNWDLVKELGVSYVIITRIKTYKTFKDEP